jgi:steroid 5-alpha reductase family enzyme
LLCCLTVFSTALFSQEILDAVKAGDVAGMIAIVKKNDAAGKSAEDMILDDYASRIIEVEQEQKVITTGPYAVVRHPMYSAVLIMYAISPLALGSIWAMISVPFLAALLVARIRNEGKVLAERLERYRDYMRRVRYRIIPGVW